MQRGLGVWMLRYVRIDSKRNVFLGAEGLKDVVAESATKQSSASAIEFDILAYFQANTGRVWSYRNLVTVARITAGVHFLIALIIFSLNIHLEKNDDKTYRDLRTVTTKTVMGWVGAGVSPVVPVRDFGPNPLHPDQRMTISEECKIPGDYASRSNNFNVRAFSFEVGELDLRWMMFGFFSLSFIFQMYGSWNAECYIKPLLRGDARRSHLVEYSISASLMMMAMCAQVGVTDVHILSNVFSNTWACMIFGLLSDVFSDAEIAKVFHGVSIVIPMGGECRLSYKWIAHLAGWFTLTIAGSVMVTNIETFRTCFEGVRIPDEIVAAIFFEVVLFFCFGLVQVYTLLKKPSKVSLPRTLEIMIWYDKIKSTADPTASTVIEQQRISRYTEEKTEYISTQKARMDVACRAEYGYLMLSLIAKVTLGGFLYISAAMGRR